VIQPSVTLSTVAPRRSPLKRILVAVLWIAVIAALGFSVWKIFISAPASVIHRLMVSTEESINLSDGSAVAISPDGRNVIYAGQKDNSAMLYLRPIDQFEAKLIEGTLRATSPFFSADGKWLGFEADGELKKVSIFGGVPNSICKVNGFLGSYWTAKDIIYFSSRISPAKQGTAIFQISANGGTPKMVTQINDTTNGEILCWPEMLPNQKILIFTAMPANSRNPNDGSLESYYLDTGLRRTILKGGIFGRYGPTGHIVAAWSGGILAAPFNSKTALVTGPTVPILNENFQYNSLSPNFVFSNDGTLIYILGRDLSKNKKLAAISESGKVQELSVQLNDFHYPVEPANGNFIATQIGDESNSQIWLYNKNKAALEQLTHSGINCFPIWSPDGDHVTYSCFTNGQWHIYDRLALSDANATKYTSSEYELLPCSWTSDGKILAFTRRDPTTNLDLWLMKIKNDTTLLPFLNSKNNERQAAISPNGEWIAYISDQSGFDEVYLRSFADARSEVKISSKGGVRPSWHRNGKNLYYLQTNKIMEVVVERKTKFIVSQPKLKQEINATDKFFSITPQGDQFLFVSVQATEPVINLHVVLNWFDELKTKLPVSKKYLGIEF
jgi:Tol biopolymer transport system component